MKTEKMKCLRLELQSDTSISSMYLIFQTHFAMYSYLQDQGYSLEIYQPLGADRFSENGVIYIKTNHQGFFESCLKNYAHDFNISGMDPNFEPAGSHGLMFGTYDSFQQSIGIS
tara:strand:- start:167 stop:508 length:342 start_codon:yes stop_codon:yes gene_type:complete